MPRPLSLAALAALAACSALDLFSAPPHDDARCPGARRYLRDGDGDGFGAGAAVLACAAPPGHVTAGGDCDDARDDVYPSATERCDGRDNDCDDAVDEAPDADATCGGRAVRSGVCRGGACVAVCERDRGDCDGDARNGCEADLTSAVAHCGACGMACGVGSPCVDGRCASPLTAIAAGSQGSVDAAGRPRSFTCAVRGGDRSAGRHPRVFCWGDNADGQLGVAPSALLASRAPVSFELPLASDTESVALGARGGCALAFGGPLGAGSLWCWGARREAGDDPSLRRVLADYNVQTVAMARGADGRDAACAIEASNGRLWCWGSNASGNLGLGAEPWIDEPTLVSLGRRPDLVAMGPTHTCATSGTGVFCWGRNDAGQLGDGTLTARDTPPTTAAFRAPAGTTLVRVVVGRDFSCALVEATEATPPRRSLWCWGANPGGWFGADPATLTAPVSVALTGLVDVAAGGGRWCGLRADGAPRCAGELFYRDDARVFQGPTELPSLGVATRASLGPDHACVLVGASDLRCWGENASGQCGDGSDARRRAPTLVAPLRHHGRVVAASGAFVLLRADGSVGSRDGALAARFPEAARDLALDDHGGGCAVGFDGALRCSMATVPALDAPARQVALARERLGSTGVVACTRTAEGRVRCLRATPRASTPPGEATFVALSPAPAAAVDAVGLAASPSGAHFCAWTAGGEAYCWGDNTEGQAAPTRPEPTLPTAERVTGIDDVVEVAVGPRGSCARRAGGGVVCWGRSGLAADAAVTAVPELRDAARVTLGAAHACALRRNGRVVCWGANPFGQLGDGTTIERRAPVEVRGIEDADEVTAGAEFTCARRRTGQVLCWGRNDVGQLDDGTFDDRALPTPTRLAP